MNGELIINALVALFASIANFSYFFVHANGKKYIRFISAIILLYFAVIQFAAGVGYLDEYTFGRVYLRDWMPALLLISVFDVYVDWRLKNDRRKAKQ